MPESHHASHSITFPDIARPLCPTCQSQMSLVHIKNGSSGLDLRTFECTTCDHVHKEFMTTGAMTSDTFGWLFADLYPPK
jgi:hypothetical protein